MNIGYVEYGVVLSLKYIYTTKNTYKDNTFFC
jgi:hypothetical protein